MLDAEAPKQASPSSVKMKAAARNRKSMTYAAITSHLAGGPTEVLSMPMVSVRTGMEGVP